VGSKEIPKKYLPYEMTTGDDEALIKALGLKGWKGRNTETKRWLNIK